MIVEMMKKNEEVYLFFGEWCLVLYRPHRDEFSFFRCRPLITDADYVFDHYENITYMMHESNQDLICPQNRTSP